MIRVVGIFVVVLAFLVGAFGANINAQTSSPSALPSPTPSTQSGTGGQATPEFDYERAYKDYVFALDVYETAHSDYLLTRAQYLQAKTLIAETRARDSASSMLEARDDVVITYLRTLRMKLAGVKGVTGVTRDGYLSRLDTELGWFLGHEERISSVGTLQDVVKDSNEAGEQFARVTEPLSYEVLSIIALGELGLVREDIGLLLGDIKVKTSLIRLKGDHDVQTVERWILAAENKITRALDKEIEAQISVQKIIEPKRGPSVYTNVLLRADESLQFLKEASSNMREIIRAIRTKE